MQRAWGVCVPRKEQLGGQCGGNTGLARRVGGGEVRGQAQGALYAKARPLAFTLSEMRATKGFEQRLVS